MLKPPDLERIQQLRTSHTCGLIEAQRLEKAERLHKAIDELTAVSLCEQVREIMRIFVRDIYGNEA